MTTASIEPEKVLRDLRELWSNLGREQETAGGVLRACAMTLLVVAEDDADAEQARKTVAVLMHDHPCRAVVLKMTSGDSELDARVFAECWMPFGANQQICAEGIEITAGASRFDEVARFLVPLVVPDLPVVLWCRGNRWFDPGPYDALFSLAGKIIFDSSNAPDALTAIGMLQGLRTRTQARIADLAWARLTPGRQVLANVFDDRLMSPAAVSAVRIEYASAEAPDSRVLHFRTWLARCLPGAIVTLERISGSDGLQRVTFSGSGEQVEVVWEGPSAIEIRMGDRRCRSVLPATSDDAAMREELSIPGDDPVFDRVLAGS